MIYLFISLIYPKKSNLVLEEIKTFNKGLEPIS